MYTNNFKLLGNIIIVYRSSNNDEVKRMASTSYSGVYVGLSEWNEFAETSVYIPVHNFREVPVLPGSRTGYFITIFRT